jgi:hypothetical protein
MDVTREESEEKYEEKTRNLENQEYPIKHTEKYELNYIQLKRREIWLYI